MWKQCAQIPTRMIRDLKVSAIGYGAMGLTHGYGAIPSHEESIRLLREAYKMDTHFLIQQKFMEMVTMNNLLEKLLKKFVTNAFMQPNSC